MNALFHDHIMVSIHMVYQACITPVVCEISHFMYYVNYIHPYRDDCIHGFGALFVHKTNFFYKRIVFITNIDLIEHTHNDVEEK